MIEFQTPYIYFCLANFLFVFTTMICGIVRWSHICLPYRDNIDFYFPARKIVSTMFFIQLFQSVYWWNVFSDETFLFARFFSPLIIIPFLVMIEKRYFFFFSMRIRELCAHFFIPALLLLPLLYDIFSGQSVFQRFSFEIKIIATGYVLFELVYLVKSQWRIRKILRNEYEMQYADLSHFPKSFAQKKRGIALCFSFLLLFGLWSGSHYLKLITDLILSIASVRFLVEILSSQRTNLLEENDLPGLLDIKKTKTNYLSAEHQAEIEQQIIGCLMNENLFRNPDLSLDMLVKVVGCNRTYISEAIRNSIYGSFYKMVNQFRLEYACRKIIEDPAIKMEHLAFDSGYSSRYVFTRVFKEVYGETPSEWKKRKDS